MLDGVALEGGVLAEILRVPSCCPLGRLPVICVYVKLGVPALA